MQLFPNPINGGYLTIQTNAEKSFKGIIKIYNLLGETILKQTDVRLHAGSNQQMIDIQDFAAGAYFLTLSDGMQQITQKFVIYNE